jgi:exopolysaccharide production protein ExoQ
MNSLREQQLSLRRNPSAPWLLMFCVLAAFACFNFDPYYAYKYAYRDVLIESVDLIASAITTADDAGRQFGLLGLGGVGGALMLVYFRRLAPGTLLALLLILFVAWACLSVLWSTEPDLTLRRVIVLILLMIGATGVAARCSLHEIAWIGFVAGFVLLTAGILCELALGTFNPFTSGYRFAGLLNPIGTAEVSSVLILSSILLARRAPRLRMLLGAVSVFAFLIILMTRSRGPLAALLIAIAVHIVLTWPITRTFFAALLAVLSGLLLVAFGYQLAELALLGRTEGVMTLTGRLPLWEVMFTFIGERPLLGYGYNSFWTPARFGAVESYTGFHAADAHNSYINMILGVGFAGAMLWLVVLTGAILKSVQLSKWFNAPAYVFACTMLVFHALNGTLLSVFLAEHFPSFLALVVLAHIVFVAPPLKILWGIGQTAMHRPSNVGAGS